MGEPKIPPHIRELIELLEDLSPPIRRAQIAQACEHIYRAGFIDGAVAHTLNGGEARIEALP